MNGTNTDDLMDIDQDVRQLDLSSQSSNLLTQSNTSTKKERGKTILNSTQSSSSATATEHLPWVEKYRPTELSDLVSQKNITNTILRFIDEKKLPHLLFYGPPGTGKTSTILACARKLYGPRFKGMILELNASDDRGIDVVREQIKNFASTRTMFSSTFKLIILDEADSMTQIAQAALRRIIEKYSSHVRFCIICNYISKIIPALQSRCTRFRFSPLENEAIEKRLNTIVQLENVDLRPDGLTSLLKLSQGDMRRALNILQSAHAAFQMVDEHAVHATTASPLPKDIENTVVWLLNEDFTTAVQHLQSLCIHKGYALLDLVIQVFHYVTRLDMPSQVKIWLYEALSDIEYKLSQGCSEKLQLGALVGAFRIAVDRIQTSSSSTSTIS